MDSTMNKNGSIFPLAIALTGLAGLVAAGVWRLSTLDAALVPVLGAVLALYAVWIVSEFRITAGETHKDTGDDKGTCEAYAIARFVTVLAALAFPSLWQGDGVWLPLGTALFVAGIGFRVYAIRTLGSFYSHRVRTPSAETIISTGPYRYLRHPAYAGMLLAHVGIVVLFFNWFVLTMFALVFVPALVRRIRVEEAHLLAIPRYAEFAAGRARVLPGVW